MVEVCEDRQCHAKSRLPLLAIFLFVACAEAFGKPLALEGLDLVADASSDLYSFVAAPNMFAILKSGQPHFILYPVPYARNLYEGLPTDSPGTRILDGRVKVTRISKDRYAVEGGKWPFFVLMMSQTPTPQTAKEMETFVLSLRQMSFIERFQALRSRRKRHEETQRTGNETSPPPSPAMKAFESQRAQKPRDQISEDFPVGPTPASGLGDDGEVRLGVAHISLKRNERIYLQVAQPSQGPKHQHLVALELWSNRILPRDTSWWVSHSKLADSAISTSPNLQWTAPKTQEISIVVAHWPNRCGCHSKRIEVKLIRSQAHIAGGASAGDAQALE